jgi:Ca-activated chloride channel family protein
MYPPVLPDVFAGNEIIVFGRFVNEGEVTARLLGTRGATEVNHTFTAEFSPHEGQYPFIAKLWAGRRIGHLLDAMRTSGETAEVKDEIVRLSKRYGIMTPYTSFLAAPEEVRVAMRRDQGEAAGAADDLSGAAAPRMLARQSIEASKLKSGGGSYALAPSLSAGPAGGPAAKEESDANISGRRFTNMNGVWTDWDAVNPKGAITDTLVIKPYSEAYFQLAANKEIAAILSLGDRVIFLWGNVLIEINESGAEKWNNNWPRL